MAKFNITNKTTKEDAARLLGANLDTVRATKDQSLVDRVVYTIQHMGDKSTTRKSVIDVLREVMKATGTAFVVPAAADEADTTGATPHDEKPAEDTKPADAPKAENLVKKSGNKGKKSDEPKTKGGKPETKKTEDEKPEAKSEDTSDEKPKGKKKTVIKPRQTVLASAFPETIEIGGQTFNLDHSVKSLSDLSDDKEYEFAFYWEARHLKQFPYHWHGSPKNPDGFPNDLDTAQLIYVSDEGKVAYAVSDYTEAAYTIYPRDLEEFEGIRFCNGIEYQIYSRPADTSDESEDE